MAKNRTYTSGKQSVGTPTLNRTMYMQLIRGIRKERESAESKQKAVAAGRAD